MLIAEDFLRTSTGHIFFDRAADDKCQGSWKVWLYDMWLRAFRETTNKKMFNHLPSLCEPRYYFCGVQ